MKFITRSKQRYGAPRLTDELRAQCYHWLSTVPRNVVPRSHRPSDARTACPGAGHGAAAHNVPGDPTGARRFQKHS